MGSLSPFTGGAVIGNVARKVSTESVDAAVSSSVDESLSNDEVKE